MSEITQYPWVTDDSEAFRVTKSNIGQKVGLYVELDEKHGALFYAGVANVAADFMDYPEWIKEPIENEIQEEADRFVGRVKFDRSKGSGQALYSLCADVHDASSEYRSRFGQKNVQPLIVHFSRIKQEVYKAHGFE